MDIRVTGTVRAPPAKVFAYVADLANWPAWQSDMKQAELVSGSRGQPGARYHYVSKAMGMTFDSTVDIVRVESGRSVTFEGPWVGMIRPRGTYTVEPAPEGSKVTLNPHPEMRGLGKLLAGLMGGKMTKMNEEHLAGLRKAVEPPA